MPTRAALLATVLPFVVAAGVAACQHKPSAPPADPATAAPAERRLSDAARAVLTAPDAVELLAVTPEYGVDAKSLEGKPRFHDQPVLGQATVATPEDRAAVSTEILRGLDYAGPVAACFDPHHAATFQKGDRTVDVVVCYACAQTMVYGPGPNEVVGLATSAGPEAAMNRLFAAHGLTTTTAR